MHLIPRAIAVLAAGSLLVPLTTTAPAAAAGEATPPAPRSVADLCVATPDAATFTDSAGTFAAEIECLATAAITLGGPAGLPENRYGPALEVRRDSMATFLVRLAETADALDVGGTVKPLPEPGQKSFRDVPANGIHSVNILRLAEAGIVEGGPGGRPADEYAPTVPVTRAQMASFIVRTLEFVLGENLTVKEDYFTDDERVAVHQRAINALAALGVGVGDGKDLFDPTSSIRRGQMAAFLTRALAVLEARDVIIPLPYTVQLLGLNDFHGNLEPPSGSGGRVQTGPTPAEGSAPTVDAGGAEFLATQLAELAALERDDERSITVAAGDLIGATPLLSAAFQDEPTIESLGLAGLDYASVGNHEFDEGKDELLRIQNGGCFENDCAYRGGDTYDGADFQYLSANVVRTDNGEPLLPATAVRQLEGPDVGFIGMTLEGTRDVVSQEGVEGLDFRDEVETANEQAAELQRQGVETIVVLLHEGGVQTGENAWDVNGCNGLNGPIVDIANGMSDAIDVVVSGHTHQAYNCEIDGKLVTSASSFGRVVTDIGLAIHPVTGDVFAASAENTIVTRTQAKDPAQTALIKRYRDLLGPIAGRVVGSTAEVLDRVQEELFPNSASRDGVQKGESVLGNLIADAQLAATDTAAEGGAVAAFMNPGGVRADIAAGDITYEDAFTVQPFANNLVTMDLTGEQLRCLLEQQFQLGTTLYPSGSVRYTVRRSGMSAAAGADPCTGTRVDPASFTIDGEVVVPAQTYTITANSFLSGGGDRFSVFTQGTNKVTRNEDLREFVAYLEANDPVTPPATDRITVVE